MAGNGNGNGNGEFSFGNGTARNGLAKIRTTHKKQNGICHDDSGPPVKAQTIDELHSLQKKKSAPTTPIKGTQSAFALISDELRQKQQLQSLQKEKLMEKRMLSQEYEAALTLLQIKSSGSCSSIGNPKPVVLPSHPGHAQPPNLSLRNLDPPDYPPVMSLMGLIGDCSVPYVKKLTKTDMNHGQARLSINKDYAEKCLLKLLNEDEVIEKGIPVTVYDIKGGIYNMNFRVWAKTKSMYVLMKGWKNFCIQHNLRHHDDFLISVTLWMFRHVQTGKLCFIVSPKTVKKDIEEVTNLD